MFINRLKQRLSIAIISSMVAIAVVACSSTAADPAATEAQIAEPTTAPTLPTAETQSAEPAASESQTAHGNDQSQLLSAEDALAVEIERDPDVPDLPFADNADPALCGIPQPWNDDTPAYLSGTYEGELIQPIVLLYDSHLRRSIKAQAPHGTEVQILLSQSNPTLDYFLVKIIDAEQPTEGWVPAPFVAFEPPPPAENFTSLGLNAPAPSGRSLQPQLANASIDLNEVQTLLPPDAIRAIEPDKVAEIMVTAEQAEAAGIDPNVRVLGVSINGESHAYPLPFMSRHEIVNTVLGGRLIAATW